MATKKTKTDDVICISNSQIESFGSLGRELKVSPKSKVNINKPGLTIEYSTPTIDIVVGIGNNHIARLIMGYDDWVAFKKGAKIDITPLKEFKKEIK